MTPVSFRGDEVTPELLVRREGVDITAVVGHKVVLTPAILHVYPNNGFQPGDSVAQLSLANRVGGDESGFAARASTFQRAVDQKIQLAWKSSDSDTDCPQLTNGWCLKIGLVECGRHWSRTNQWLVYKRGCAAGRRSSAGGRRCNGGSRCLGEMVPGDVEEGSLAVAEALEAEIATFEDVDRADVSDCTLLACFLAAAFVCQPHKHSLFAEGVKNDSCLHFWIAVIASRMSLFERFCPPAVKAGRPSARSISCSVYCPIPRK